MFTFIVSEDIYIKEYPYKEFMTNNSMNIRVESFEVAKTSEGLNVTGLALPFGKVSRNGFLYLSEGINEKAGTLVGRPVLFNHDPEKVIGHVESIEIKDDGLHYVMDLDSEGPYGWVARKVERGDLKNVSIQAQYDPKKSFITDEGVTHAYIEEFYELSVVTIPGFADTTAQVMEKLKAEVDIMKEQKPKAVESEEPKKVDETPEEPKDKVEESEPSVDDRIKALEETLKALGDKVTSFEKQMEEYGNKEPEKESEDDEKKVEEAIRKDKKSVSTESYQKETKVVTTEDLKNLFVGGN